MRDGSKVIRDLSLETRETMLGKTTLNAGRLGNFCYFLVVFLYVSDSFISPVGAKDQQAVGSSIRKQELEAALDQVSPAEIEEFVNALGCKCVEMKCHCISEHGTNLSTTLEKLLTLHHRTATQKKPSRQELVKSKNANQEPSVRVETFARALGCECVASRCRCFGEEGPGSSAALNDLMNQMNTDVLEEEAMFQESVASRMGRFFRDGFRRLMETFTRQPH